MMPDFLQQQCEQLQDLHGDDWEAFLSIEVPDVDIEYVPDNGDNDCPDGACKI
jgi:hypothetical protein